MTELFACIGDLFQVQHGHGCWLQDSPKPTLSEQPVAYTVRWAVQVVKSIVQREPKGWTQQWGLSISL